MTLIIYLKSPVLNFAEYNRESLTKALQQTHDGMTQAGFSSVRDNYQIKIGDNNTNFFGGTHTHGK